MPLQVSEAQGHGVVAHDQFNSECTADQIRTACS
jgi:hypothetical protein